MSITLGEPLGGTLKLMIMAGYFVRLSCTIRGGRLCYGEQHIEDEFGGLSQTPLDLSESGYTSISSQDFEAAWSLS
jgi:hypothetical protein